MTKIAFLTLGCKVNFYETEKMMEQFQEKGFEIVDFSDAADVYLVNTCTVTNMADRKSRQMLHRAKKKHPDSLVVAVGCYVESGGGALQKDLAVDAFFTNADKEHMAERFVEQFSADIQKAVQSNRDFRHDRTRAYLKIQDGCNQFCTYCMIPYVRGRGKLSSTPEEQILAEAREMAARGYQELVLTGIHLSSYGVDMSGGTSFVNLEGKPLLSVIKAVAAIPEIKRIRLGSLEPRIITEAFLQGLTETDKICPHFHLSLQSGCDAVLKRMNRHYSTEEYRGRTELLRRYFEQPAITTDVIVGFPGETEQEFAATRAYLGEIALADMHVFPYSPRRGTKAASMPEQVNAGVKRERTNNLLADAAQYRRRFAEQFLGRTENVLFEEVAGTEKGTCLVGHNERYVKIGVPLREAEEKHWGKNEIHEIQVGEGNIILK